MKVFEQYSMAYIRFQHDDFNAGELVKIMKIDTTTEDQPMYNVKSKRNTGVVVHSNLYSVEEYLEVLSNAKAMNILRLDLIKFLNDKISENKTLDKSKVLLEYALKRNINKVTDEQIENVLNDYSALKRITNDGRSQQFRFF